MKTELTPEDKQRLHDFIDKLGWPNDGTAEHNDMMKVAEYATNYQREQQANGLPEYFKKFDEIKDNLMTKQDEKIKQLEAERSELLERVSSLTKENERLKIANERIVREANQDLLTMGEQMEQINQLKAENEELRQEIKTLSKFDER